MKVTKVTKVATLKKTFLMFGIAVGLLAGCGTEDPTGMMDPPGDPVPGGSSPGGSNPGDPDPGGTPPVPEAPTLFAAWVIETGELIANFRDNFSIKGLILNDDGTGRLFIRDLNTDGKDCARVYVLYDGDSLVLDLAAEPLRQHANGRSMTFPFVAFDEDSLSLADENGFITNFTRVEEMPADVACGELEVAESYEGLPAPDNFGRVNNGNLVPHHGTLVYNSTNDMIERFDYANGVLFTPLGPTGQDNVYAAQTESFVTDLWTACICGSNDTIRRTDLNNVFDEIDTNDNLRKLSVDSAAYHAPTDRLWVHGLYVDGARYEFQVYRMDEDPSQLARISIFNRHLKGMAFHGDELWAIVDYASRSIVRIDTQTRDVVESYEVPDEDVNWSGLTFVGDDMYLLGGTQDGDGVIYKIVKP